MTRQPRSSFFRWTLGLLLLPVFLLGVVGGAGLSVRAAPREKPLATCPDPIIAQWTFTGAVAPAIPSPSTGAGTLIAGSGLGGPSYFGGETSSEDPAISFTGWSTNNVLNESENDYLEFQIDTSGMNAILLSFKSRVSATGPKALAIQYSTNGNPFANLESRVLTANSNWYTLDFDFSSVSALNNQTAVLFRLYGYDAGGSTGTWRLDNITFSGTCPAALGSVLINEVAWAGTAANTDHEWIELYNTTAGDISLNGWTLESLDGTLSIALSGTIPANGYFLLERNEDAIADVASNQLYSGTLVNSGMRLVLYDNSVTFHTVIDTANTDGGPWPAGSSSMHATMERIGTLPDSDTAWRTNNGVMKNGLDADGNPIWGTPKNLNAPTPTVTSTPTNTLPPPTAAAALTVVINEVAWAGTQAASDDEWIELYNPSAVAIDLTGWTLKSSDGSPNITLSGTIPAGGYFLLERSDDDTVAGVIANMFYSGSLSNNGEILRLYDSTNQLIDTANSNGGAWPAGNASTYASMQRSRISTDSDFVWVTYDANNDNSSLYAHDAAGNVIKGTPGRGNRPNNVTPTVTPQKTATAKSSSSSSSPILPVLGISEFLPRPGRDWNNDGKVDVYDEFIEIINAGRIDVDLSEYELDDEQNQGSSPYTLPAIILKPGERAVFYAAETGILLSDAGDSVRLLTTDNKVVDARTYGVARFPDQSICRIPDRMGYWNKPCFPTPGNPNALTGDFPPLPSTGANSPFPVCLLPDTTPPEFVAAECEASGGGIWNRQFWDGYGLFELHVWDDSSKEQTVFE